MSNTKLESTIDNDVDQLILKIKQADSLSELVDLEKSWFGKKGSAKLLFASLKQLPAEQRNERGLWINQLNQKLRNALKEKSVNLGNTTAISSDTIDVTLPARQAAFGSKHPNTLVIENIVAWFTARGFGINSGLEVEDDWHNFEALNIPPSHPARSMHDTFYLRSGKLLRTHTSTAQIRTLEIEEPPIYVISPGRVFRRDSDITHTPVFHQIEGMVVDKAVTFGDLKLLLTDLLKHLFGNDIKTRFRPSFFPFTEPSAEVDMSCFDCKGSGCRICSQTGWIEILGSGLIHPNVLKLNGLDDKKWQGLAFGLGVERLAMLMYGIDDLRLVFSGDYRFISQFKGISQ